jgi:hypothetical protein
MFDPVVHPWLETAHEDRAMKIVIGVVLAFALAAPVAAQDWEGHVKRNGAIVIESVPPDYPPPYPFPHVDYYPGREPDPDSYPSPPPSPEEQSRRYPSWFYCDAAYAYFPYVKTCPSGFRPVPMAAPPRDAPPPPVLAVSGLAHCTSPDGFYPYVKSCEGGWTTETAARPPGAPSGPAARWFYCEAQKAFSPYVDTCAGGWKEIAAAPQPIDPRVAPAAAR